MRLNNAQWNWNIGGRYQWLSLRTAWHPHTQCPRSPFASVKQLAAAFAGRHGQWLQMHQLSGARHRCLGNQWLNGKSAKSTQNSTDTSCPERTTTISAIA